ncbi:glycine N-acyltransferase-like protein 3 [Chanos chanos]|uniref:Glycine N-acyltransferase-like protein n=1 Tax=Chanos chanos TaxID=29144 RepID=A0A6J2V4J0_CHACN|nr:glycine N-acyltransferase-like protein 3 [Chanos chanos]
MKFLTTSDELKAAERVLQSHLPRSSKVYGFLLGINRGKPHTLEVLVDSWPDFKTIILRPDPKNERALDYMKKVTFFSTDEEVLKRMVSGENAIDWSTYFLIGGFDIQHAPLLREVAASKGVSVRGFTLVHLMTLPDQSLLPPLTTSSIPETRISTLDESHISLVNSTWKFGGDDRGYRNIKNLISHFPTCCITDDNNQPVSWVLLYDYCAMGMLYTLPEHRGKGYAKALVTIMSKKLCSQGFPVYCFIEEDNKLSYKLFSDLGFTEDPSYRAAWFEFNY